MSGFHYRPGVEAVPGYTLQKLLGRGGFGEVWRAEGPGRIPVAVKIIDKVDDKAGRKEFRALKLIKDLRHPNLISISGFWLKDAEGGYLDPDLLTDDPDSSATKPSEMIIVMDLGEKSLLERLDECRKSLKEQEKGGIPPEELLEYMEAAAKAIDYLNIRHDIQHRDIKPQNILIVGGSAQVCDFGLASAVSSVRTSMGGAGSLAYMAPEIYSTKRPSKSTDQYGLAIAYVELRTGRLPLADLESYACLDEAKRKGNLDLSWLDDAEKSVIERGAALNPEQRYASCVEMIKALRQAARGEASVLITRDTLKPFGDYLPRKRLHRRGGEEIWEATAAEGHTVQLVVRDAAESPDLIPRDAIATVRDATRRHDGLAELYEVVRLNDEGRILPARLFESANPPTFAKLALVGQHSATTLNDRIVPGGLPARQLLPLFDQIARAIDFLNAPEHDDRGRKVSIVHGHVRPVNVQVDGGVVRLSNFSGAHLLAGDDEEAPALAQVPEGPYTPPEYLQGRLTRWSDQFLLAVAYLQLRTGKPSSGLAGSTGSAGSLTARPKLDLSGLNAAEQEVIAHATNESPRDRFPDAASLVQALREAVGASVVEPPPTDRGDLDRPEGFGRSTPRDRIGAETIQQSDVMVAPRLQGTLQQPALGETAIQHDTDRGEWERKSAPLIAATASTAIPLGEPVAPGVPLAQPVPRRRSLAKPFALAAGGAALIAAAVFLGINVSNNDDHPNKFDDPVDQAVHEKILSGEFEDALKAIADANLAEGRGERLRLEVAQGWYQKNVKSLVDRGEVAKALDALDGPAPSSVTDQLRSTWRESIVNAWYGEADRQLKAKKYAEAAVLFNQIIARLGSFQDAVRLRGESLQSLERVTQSQLDSDTPAAVANLSAIIQVVVGAEGIDAIPRPSDSALRRRALLLRARAYARVKNWTKAADDIKQLPTKLETPRDSAHHEIIRLLANDKTASLLDARRVHEEFSIPADPWEKKALDGLLDRLTRAGEGQQQQKFAKAITDAEGFIKADKFADAARILDAIAKDPEQKAIADASGQQDYDELRALVLVGRTDGAPAEVKRRVEQGVDLIEDRIFNNAASRGRLVPLSRGLVHRAIEPAAANSRDRKHPALLIPAARVLAKAKSHAKADTLEDKDLAELSEELQTALADEIRRLRDATAGKPPTADSPQWTALTDLSKAAAELGLDSRLARAVLLESAVERKAPAAETTKLVTALKDPDSTSPDEPFVRYALALNDARSDQPVQAAGHLLAAYQNIFPPGTLDCKLPQEIKNAETWQRDPRRARRAAEILLAAGLAERTGPDDDPTLGQNPDRNRYTPEAAAKTLPALALAHTLVLIAQPDMKVEADTRLVRDIREHQALAAAYNPVTALTVGRERLERFIEQFPETGSTQIWIAHAAVHEKSFADTRNVADRNRTIRSLGALYHVAEAKSVSPLVIYDRVIERGFSLLASADPATEQLDPTIRAAAAALCAARGRYIMLFPSIEEKFAQKSPDQVAYDSYDRAIKFYDGSAAHYVGRGLAANNLADLPSDKVAALLQENAAAAARRADLPIEKLWARGLRGLASLQESIWVADRAEKIKKLTAAIDDFNVIEKSTLQDTTARESDEYQLFLLARGGAHLKIASFLPTKEEKQKHLTAAVAVAEQITKNYARRRHPEWAYFLWGNADEDHGLFLDDPKGYERAVEHFGRAYTEADQQNDAKGRSVALFNRGRCRYRLVADVLAPPNQTVIVNRQSATQELNRSIEDLTKSIETAKGWDLRQAEANRWLAHAYQHPLFADPDRAAKHLDDAARLAKAKNPTWPFYEVLRAEHALSRARAAADPKTFDRVTAKRFIDQANAAAKSVLDDAKDPRIDARHRVSAALVVLQGDLWLGDVAAARKQFEETGKRVAGDDRFDLAFGVAEKLLDKPGISDPRRPMSEEEADLARIALLAAKSALDKGPPGAKQLLAVLNAKHNQYWQTYLKPAYERFRTARDNQRQLLDLLHHARFHAAVSLQLTDSAEAKGALGTYTKFILESETDWNKPGRDKDQYRRDAGM